MCTSGRRHQALRESAEDAETRSGWLLVTRRDRCSGAPASWSLWPAHRPLLWKLRVVTVPAAGEGSQS